MSWDTIKADIENDWRAIITDVEADAGKIEAVLQEIIAVLAGYAAVSGAPAVTAINAVAQGLYSLVNVTATTATALDPTTGSSVTATQLVAAADAVATAVPNFAAALQATGQAVANVVDDLKADAGH